MKKDEYIKELNTISMDINSKTLMKEALYQESFNGYKKKWNLKVISLCFVSICIFLTIGIPYLNSSLSELQTKQPSLKQPDEVSKFIINNQIGDGFGFEGIMVKDVSELKTFNPYNLETPSQKMPIYHNLQKSDAAGMESNQLNHDEKQKLLKSYANKLNISNYTLHNDDNNYSLKSDICTIYLDQSSSIYIEFSRNYLQKNKISMNVKTIQEGKVITEKLYKKYREILGIENPLYHISYNYSYDKSKHWSFSISEDMNNQNESLLYSLTQQVEFYCNDNNEFNSLRIYTRNLDKKIGDYPIISLKEATNRLKTGRFITTIRPIEFKIIGHVEMTYCVNSYTDYYLPYYRFYVLYEDQESKQAGLETYVACYVSALPDGYIEEDYDSIQFN